METLEHDEAQAEFLARKRLGRREGTAEVQEIHPEATGAGLSLILEGAKVCQGVLFKCVAAGPRACADDPADEAPGCLTSLTPRERFEFLMILGNLDSLFTAWARRDLRPHDVPVLYLGNFTLRLHLADSLALVPTYCALGMGMDGRKELLALVQHESHAADVWWKLVEDLEQRGVTEPVLAVVDDNETLIAAVREMWPGIDIQRNTNQYLCRLLAHTPLNWSDSVMANFLAIINAGDESEAQGAMSAFERRWNKICPAVVNALREGAGELLTYFRYPTPARSLLRTTDAIERLNREFHRRVRSECVCDRTAGLKLLYALFACGAIAQPHLDCWEELPVLVAEKRRRLMSQRPFRHEPAARS